MTARSGRPPTAHGGGASSRYRSVGRLGLRAAEWAAAAAAFALAGFGNYRAGLYVDRVGARSPSLGEDLLLSTLPNLDVSTIFVWGFIAWVAFAAGAALKYERFRIPYLLWMYAMLILTRAGFVCLTPMGAPAGMHSFEGVALGGAIKGFIAFQNDFFFSAHTAMPFLAFLLFRRPWARVVFMAFSLLLAACVLVGRYHYSIDVAAAYFITYGFVKAHRRLFESRYIRWKLRLLRRMRRERRGMSNA